MGTTASTSRVCGGASAAREVTAQLHESSTGRCWESRVTGDDVKTNTETVFKALRK